MVGYNLFLIAFIWVAILDISGFAEDAKRILWKWVFGGKREYRDYTLKPFFCPTCMTWWTGLIYLLIAGAFTLENIALTLLIAVLTPTIKDIIILIKDIAVKIIDTIYWWLNIS